VLNAAASNIDGFLWRDTCVFIALLNRPIWSKQNLYPLISFILQIIENYDLQDSLQKLTKFSLGNNVQDATASNRDGCLLEMEMCFFNSAE
jgi:hypothetical protein